MKVNYTSQDGRMQFDFDAATQKDVFKKLAEIQSLFEEPECGCCKSKIIHFEHRTHDGNDYYKMVCQVCNAQLDYGQNKTGGGLFARRVEKDSKRPMPNNGWYHWQREER